MKQLTKSEVAARLNVAESTVKLWCRQGLFPNARVEQTPRGPVWSIPESDVKDFKRPTMGRPRKVSAGKRQKRSGKK